MISTFWKINLKIFRAQAPWFYFWTPLRDVGCLTSQRSMANFKASGRQRSRLRSSWDSVTQWMVLGIGSCNNMLRGTVLGSIWNSFGTVLGSFFGSFRIVSPQNLDRDESDDGYATGEELCRVVGIGSQGPLDSRLDSGPSYSSYK